MIAYTFASTWTNTRGYWSMHVLTFTRATRRQQEGSDTKPDTQKIIRFTRKYSKRR